VRAGKLGSGGGSFAVALGMDILDLRGGQGIRGLRRYENSQVSSENLLYSRVASRIAYSRA
jgi:hypothetical protein